LNCQVARAECRFGIDLIPTSSAFKHSGSMSTYPTNLKRSVILKDGHHEYLGRFLKAGWIIVETKKQRKTGDGEAFYDELEIILAAPEGVKIPDIIEDLQGKLGSIYEEF
jgi:hypothetical protein